LIYYILNPLLINQYRIKKPKEIEYTIEITLKLLIIFYSNNLFELNIL